jgi:hypothetical protein
MAFSKHGLGLALATSFDKALLDAPQTFPTCERGQTVLIAADLGGSHSRQLFETYSFLVLDLDMNSEWLAMQRAFRSDVMASMRRMSFKTLNDKIRRRGVTPFLQMGNLLSGWLVTFGISKNRESVFEKDGPIAPEFERILECWKPAVRERLMRVLHFSAFLMSGLCLHRQNVLWVIDEDDIASNVDQLTHLTHLLGQVYSSACETPLGHLRCATAKSDDGTRSLEDLLSYCDLAAGAVCEIATAMAGSHHRLQRTIMTPVPPLLSWKTRHILSCLAYDQSPLRRLTCLIDLKKNRLGVKVQMIRWHAMQGNLLVPTP